MGEAAASYCYHYCLLDLSSLVMSILQLWGEQLTRVMSLSLDDKLVSVMAVAAVNVVQCGDLAPR